MKTFFDPILNKLRSKDILSNGGSGYPFFEADIPLSSIQLKTGNSIPVLAGITVPAGKFIRIVAANFAYTANNGLLSFAQISIQTITGSVIRLEIRGIDPTVDSFSDMYAASNLNCIVPGEDVVISTDVDSVSGTGTAKIYILYQLIDK